MIFEIAVPGGGKRSDSGVLILAGLAMARQVLAALMLDNSGVRSGRYWSAYSSQGRFLRKHCGIEEARGICQGT